MATLSDFQEFFVIHAVRRSRDDFSIEGIFTKHDDAKEYKEALDQSGKFLAVCDPVKIGFYAISDQLISDKLGCIKEKLDRLFDLIQK